MTDRGQDLDEVIREAEQRPGGFSIKQAVPSDTIRNAARTLRLKGRCLVVGSTKTGKTTAALRIGWDLSRGTFACFRRVTYLDLSRMTTPEEDIQHIPSQDVGSMCLLIIDNWHARPDIHRQLEAFVNTHQADTAGVLFVCTRFAGSELPRIEWPRCFMDGKYADAILSTEQDVDVVAEGMIAQRLERFARSADTTRAEIELRNALTIPGPIRFLKRNLRLLAWRLKSWDPNRQPLHEVPLESTFQLVADELVRPAPRAVATLSAVAALSQWELPYRATGASGHAEEDHLFALEEKNIIVAVDGRTAWMMDPTDAYLHLVMRYGEQWHAHTVETITQQLAVRPADTWRVTQRLIVQASPAIATELTTTLLSNPETRERLYEQLVQQLSQEGASEHRALSLLNTLYRQMPLDSRQRAVRLAITRTLVRPELMELLGGHLRARGIAKTMWLLAYLAKDTTANEQSARALLDALGDHWLISHLNTAGTRTTQATLLRAIGRFDPARLLSVRPRVRLLRGKPRRRGLRQLIYTIARATVAGGERRRVVLEQLREVDHDYLMSELTENSDRIQWLQQLIESALWLDVNEAERIADGVPELASAWSLDGAGPRVLSYLVQALYWTKRDSAVWFAGQIVEGPLTRLAITSPDANIGRLLATIGKTLPDGVSQILSKTNNPSAVFASTPESMRADLLIALSVYAPSEANELWRAGVFRGWATESGEGYAAIAGAMSLIVPELPIKPTEAPTKDLSHLEGTFLLSYLCGVAAQYGLTRAYALISTLANSPLRFPYLPIYIGRNVFAARGDGLLHILRRALGADVGQRRHHVELAVLSAHLAGAIEWSRGSLDWTAHTHRGLQTALALGALQPLQGADPTITRTGVNSNSAEARRIVDSFERVVAPLKANPLQLSELDKQIGDVIPLAERDRMLGMAILMGLVRWSVEAEATQLCIRYQVDRPIDRERLLDLLRLQ